LAKAFDIREGKLIACHLKEEVVQVPLGVQVIGEGALKGCTSIKQIVLPDTVKKIEAYAFKGCRQLESIFLPEGLLSIGAYAFHRCHHLREIQLPKSITELSECTFLYCDGLEMASLPNVRWMGRQTFVNATHLKKLTISSALSPKCLNDTFTGCSRISEISIVGMETENRYQTNDLIAILEAKDEIPEIVKAIAADIYRMMDIENRVLVEFHVEAKEVEIPEGILEIGKSCFFNKRGILQIHLPKSLKKIGERAFRNCINLEHIVLKNPDIQLCKDAFQNCTTLKQVTLEGVSYPIIGLPDGAENRNRPKLIHQIHTQLLENFCISGTILLRYWGNEARVTVPEGITVIGERAFAGNEAVGKLILPESVIEIQREAFADCLLLQTLNFPKGLKKIGVSAFEGCVKLLRAEIPEKITVLRDSVFSRCRKLGQVVFAGNELRNIEKQAFYDCFKLSDLNFPESLEKIGDLAFYQCHGLRRLKLPKSVFHIGAEAFSCCQGLLEVEIKGALTECGRNAFAYSEKWKMLSFTGAQRWIPDYFAWKCCALEEINFSNTLQNIGFGALEGTAFLKRLSMPKILGTILLDGTEMEGEVEIPEGITAIAGGAFYGNEKITAIRLPDSLKFIGKRAFCGCLKLKEIKLPKKLEIISKEAFAYCTGLEKIVSEGVIKEVEEKACYQCSALKEIPSLDFAEIGEEAFAGCKELKKVSAIDARIGAFSFQDMGWYKIGNTMINGKDVTGEVTISAGILAIAPYAFFGNHQITRLILPEGLKEIGAFAFCGCIRLCEVWIPDSVEEIGESAFCKCSSLLTFSTAAKEIGKQAFSFCKTLRFAFFSKAEELKDEVFWGCSSLQKVEAKKLLRVGKRSFGGCVKLKEVPTAALTKIGEEAFSGCEEIHKIFFPAPVQILEKAFMDCCGLIELSFFTSDFELDCTAFWGCTFLEKIQMDGQTYQISGYEDLFQKKWPKEIRAIYASALGCFCFQNTKAITEYRTNARAVRIPNGILAIHGEVFKDCIHLEQVEIPQSVEYIGERAFWGSGWLKQRQKENPLVISNHILLDGSLSSGSVCIPQEVCMISGWAFANCYGLRELTILNPRLIIEPHTFRNCIYLKKVTMADKKSYLMKGISSRKEESLPAVVRQIFEDALNCYKTDENGVLTECTGNITNFSLVNGITAIGDRVFQESNLLTHAVFTLEVKRIGESAFARCKWLSSVTGTAGVEEIGIMAFSGCIRLQKFEFSNCLTVIGERAFEGCSVLEEVVLPEGIREIPRRAFFRCRKLYKLTLPNTLERIGEEAFAFCDSLKEVVLPQNLKAIEKRGFAWCRKLKLTKIPSGAEISKQAFEFSNFESQVRG